MYYYFLDKNGQTKRRQQAPNNYGCGPFKANEAPHVASLGIYQVPASTAVANQHLTKMMLGLFIG